ncbi:MAG TPA: hypothetical protein VIJ22_11295 [Polyangiaceae bacterium]
MPLAAGISAAIACSHGSSTTARPLPVITVAARDTRFVVREHMLAALEMQLSGEPFATAMGRQLANYSRDWVPPNIYFDSTKGSFGPRIDLPGFSSAVESYEYSKQPMNNLAFESGAGLSLAYAPLLDPTGGGAAGCANLRSAVQHFAGESNASARFVSATATPDNPLGWPGIWPTLEPFESFDPTLATTSSVAELCSITSDDDPGATGALISDDYECDANTLHLPSRAAQIESAITPGSSGWAAWKSALWIMNYLELMHDADENPITGVAALDLPDVGQPGNGVTGTDLGAVVGTYLGSSNIEGFQAGMMLTALDNEADDWLVSRTTTDGATLGGFADLSTALAYDASSPLRWFPAEVTVVETSDPACSFPRASGFTITSGGSHLLDIAGLLGAYASLYALTDLANTSVGGSPPTRVYFDGDPFPQDDQLPDGEDTLHDRALGMIRVALVDLARMHVDPGSGLPVDDVTVDGGVPTRGTTLSAPTAAYALLALRTTRRALSDQLTLYLNLKPDTVTVATPLDTPGLGTAAPMDTVTGELNTLVGALAGLFYDGLTDATGRAWPGWDVAQNAPASDDDALDAHTAAIRALLQAFLATGDTRYRDRALAVYERVEATFWDPWARLYRPSAGDTSSTVVYTPMRFALVQAMLRDVYELAASRDGQDALAAQVLDRVARMNKLVLDGWDDRNGDQLVDWPAECVQGLDASGVPRGGLQMAERTLSGETGSAGSVFDAGPRVATVDREHDCVPEISATELPSALADSITFQLTSAP